MRSRTCTVAISALAIAAVLILLGTATRASEPIQVRGKMACKTPERHSIPVEGDPGHVLVVQIETCVGTASGDSARFDGGQQTWFELDDLVRGAVYDSRLRAGEVQGREHGYHRLWGAQVATMINGKPEWTALGTLRHRQ